MVDFGTAPDRTEGNSVDFIVRRVFDAGEFHTYIAQHAGIVRRVVTAVFGTHTALDGLFAEVVGRLAEQDDTAPVTGLAAAGSLGRSEDNRAFRRTLCHDFAAPFDNERTLRSLVALYHHTGLDGQRHTVGHINEPFERIDVRIGQRHVGSDFEIILRTVAQFERFALRRILAAVVRILVATYGSKGREEHTCHGGHLDVLFHLFLFD